MRERFGIILLDGTTLILRVYEINDRQWKLFYYLCTDFPRDSQGQLVKDAISIKLAEVFSLDYLHHIAEWKICARNVIPLLTATIADITNMRVENLTEAREQELLCKGMFTELW